MSGAAPPPNGVDQWQTGYFAERKKLSRILEKVSRGGESILRREKSQPLEGEGGVPSFTWNALRRCAPAPQSCFLLRSFALDLLEGH